MRRAAVIHISGIVQGVGFRPFVFNLAGRLHITGWVRNTSAGVDIHAEESEDVLAAFIKALKDEAPPLSRIDEFSVVFTDSTGFTKFEIQQSEPIPEAFQPISPDVAICEDCRRELFDSKDRRYRYPFINCTNCGPRFTIIKDIPYDRLQTTMARFPLCPDCTREYFDPADRRFHAQPVACPTCGPKVWIERVVDGKFKAFGEGEAAIQAMRSLLAAGQIVAVKGLGGFHLACDASNSASVNELRLRKLRVDKPFAIMMPDLETVEKNCWMDRQEHALLNSPARPILLLRRRKDSIITREVAPGQDWIGVMLPYTPLHYLLLEKSAGFPEALVMTSGNLSEEPIAIDNDDARLRLNLLTDAFLMHDRDIYMRCDDSVVRVFEGASHADSTGALPVETDKQSGARRSTSIYPLRRSRGYAPFPVKLPWQVPQLLATGAELKNTFCLTNRSYAFLSHHIGDLENYETLRSFEEGIEHFEHLFRVKPQAIAHDLHPDYLATRYALRRSLQENLPAVGVQHHHAHIAAGMVEHGLDGSRPVIGVAFDGTGYGEDEAIWGGEFLVADYKSYERRLHLEYFPLPGGDAAIRQPARTALALLWSLGLDWNERLAPVAEFRPEDRVNLIAQLEKKINTPPTSSIGRLFDAVAALSHVRQKVNYEAQAAIEFEALSDEGEQGAYLFEINQTTIGVGGLISALTTDVLAGALVSRISARFHNGLAQMVVEACTRIRGETGIREVVLSGGVWQNITLLGRTLSLLQNTGFQVYLHRVVPANDGGLSLGQAVIAAQKLTM